MRWWWIAGLLAGCAADAPVEEQPDLAENAAVDLGAPPDLAAPRACSPDVPRAVPNQLAVLPDDGETMFVETVKSAKSSLRVMVYLMGYGGILDALTAQAKAGVDVRVILDLSEQSVNQKYFDALTAAGAHVEWSDPQFTYMHAKVLVADGREAVVSTGNYSLSQMQRERNYAARVDDPADVAVLAALFDADWARKAPDLSCTRLLVSPVNSRDRLLAFIDSAKQTLLVESMELADSDVRNAIALRKAAGVDVRVLLADPSWISANTDAAAWLAARNIPARRLAMPYLHVKSIIADGARAYAGSENLSWTSLSKNREVGLLLDEADAIARMNATFEKDWAAGSAF